MKLLAPLAIIGLLIALLVGCRPDVAASDFTIELYSGEEFRLSQQAGNHPVVLNFWYPSCPPCREELPHLEAAWEEYRGQGVHFLGLFVPRGFDTEGDAKYFVDELGLTFDFATDRRAEITARYDVEVFPTTFFIDKTGRVSAKATGALNHARLTRIIEKMVNN